MEGGVSRSAFEEQSSTLGFWAGATRGVLRAAWAGAARRHVVLPHALDFLPQLQLRRFLGATEVLHLSLQLLVPAVLVWVREPDQLQRNTTLAEVAT